jgi:hypothetical protein
MAADVAVTRIMAQLTQAGVMSPAATSSAAVPHQTPAVQHLAEATVDAINYGRHGESKNMSDTTLTHTHLVSTPLGFHIEAKTRAKIWSNAYIEYSTLLPQDPSKRDESPSKLALNIDQWLTAHNIYTYILLDRHPQLAQPLVKYTEVVRDLAKRCGMTAANYYDETFRSLRQDHPELRFDVPHHEIWMRASTLRQTHANHTQQQPFRGRKPNPRSTVSKGHCHKFNAQDARCNTPQCPYTHRCSTCDQQHPKFRCPQSTTGAAANVKPAGSNRQGPHTNKAR